MLKFAANLSMLYQEYAFLDRFEAAAHDGFNAVEYFFPYAFAKSEIAARLKAHGLQQVLFNAPPGDWAAGERGLASLPGRETEFRNGIALALDYAQALDCPRIHVMAGLLPSAAVYAEQYTEHFAEHYATYISNLRWAAAEAAGVQRQILIEPINVQDMPGYFLNRQNTAHQVLTDVGASNLKVQMDLYHCQMMEGDLATKLRQYIPTGNVAHVQIAGVPGRHEPDIGEINYNYLLAFLDELGYEGWVGCEYHPHNKLAGGTRAGIEWLNLYKKCLKPNMVFNS